MIGIGARAWTNEFESYVALQPFVPRPENLTHGSGPDFLKNSIVTYDPAIHAQRSAGMLGCVSFAVNNRMHSATEYGTLRTTRATRRSLPSSASLFFIKPRGERKEPCRAIILFRLRIIRQLVIPSTGRISRQSCYRYEVWPFKMGHNQAQEGRARRQARQDFYPSYQGNQHCREEWRRRP